MRILVTGGAGFIESHLCDRLIERKDEIWCVDNLRLGRRRNIAHLEASPRFHFLELDILNRSGFNSLFDKANFEAVFHLAANSDIAACRILRTYRLKACP
jgi:UDP-glucose 4-epimerase